MLFLFKNYMDYLSRLYEREIKDFFEVAKIKMTGTTKESKKFGKPRHFSSLISILLKMVLFYLNGLILRLFKQGERRHSGINERVSLMHLVCLIGIS